uniref:hypothetical protein n=1 Tax=Nonomuraea bangladeshensis TaxID=404385 RepID=UPI003F496E6E
MAHVHIDDGTLVVEMTGLDKLWTLKSRLTIPLGNVRGVTYDPGMIAERKGIRAPGVHLPGVIVAGTFHLDGEQVFWDVRNPAKAIVIQLADERYTRLVVQVDDPRAAVTLIEDAITTS